MTATLLLLLRGPMQSWGDDSRYATRATGTQPTKSGVLGLIAAAQGRRRTDAIEDLARLRFAVRVDQPGSVIRDYQTAERWQTKGSTSLVSRYYLSDAVFVAAVEAEDRGLLEGIADALKSPRFPLYLGRRSCPANVDLVLGIDDADAISALRTIEWKASNHHRRMRPRKVTLPILRDGASDEGGFAIQDVPLSFDQQHRRYGWRTIVTEEPLHVENDQGSEFADPFFETVISA